MIIGGYGISNLGSDVSASEIKSLKSSINQDKPLEELRFDDNFKIESTPKNLSENFSKNIQKIDSGIFRLMDKISSLNQKLSSLLGKRKKPEGLIENIKKQIKMYTTGLKNLRGLKRKHLKLKSKTEKQVNQNLSKFTGSPEAKDALYNRGGKLLAQFPNLRMDFRFLLTQFSISLPQTMINQTLLNGNLSGLSLGFFSPGLSGLFGFDQFNIFNIMQMYDVNQLSNILNTCFARNQQLFAQLNILNQAENFEMQKLMKLQMDLLRFNNAQAFAKTRKVFFKGKEMLFKGFSKALDFASKAVHQMSVALEGAAQGLEAAAAAAAAIPLVGPAIAAALRATAKALRIMAKMLKKASKVLKQKSKLMQNKANHMKKMQSLMNKRINYLEQLKNRVNQHIQHVRANINNIRIMKQNVINNINLNQQLMQMVIMRLMMLGENPMIPQMGIPGMGMPGMGIPGMGIPGMGIPGMGIPGMGIPGMGMPGMGIPGMGMPGTFTPPMLVPNMMMSVGLNMMNVGISLSLFNPGLGVPLFMMGAISFMSGNIAATRRNMMNPFMNSSITGSFGSLGGPFAASSSIFRPTNVRQRVESLLTRLAQNIINRGNDPRVMMQKQYLKQIYLQVAQRIDISPNVRQLVSQAVGEDLSNITPRNVSAARGAFLGSALGLTMGMFMGGPLGALAGAISGGLVGGVMGLALHSIMNPNFANQNLIASSLNPMLSYL